MEGFCLAIWTFPGGSLSLFICFFLCKEPFFLFATEIQQGEKLVRKRSSSFLQISLESYNSPMPEKLPFPWWACATTHNLSGGCPTSGWSKLWVSSGVSRCRQKLPPMRSAAAVRRVLSQQSSPYSSEKKYLSGILVRQEILAALRGEGCRASLSFRVCRVWFSQELDFPQNVTRTQKLESAKTLRTLNEDTQFIILLVLREYDTQKSGLTPLYSAWVWQGWYWAGAHKSSSHLSQSSAQYPWTLFPLFAVFCICRL